MNSNNYVNKENLHVVTIKDREMLTVTGVIDVINFDENLVEASTACGDITIDGEGLKISQIARGVAIGNELEYTDEITLGRSIVNRVDFKV